MAHDRLMNAAEQVKRWMLAHGAGKLVENLAPGATAQELAVIEQRFGYPLPDELKALWSLHHGQREEHNGFLEFRDLLDSARSLEEVDSVLPALEVLREKPECWAKAGLTAEEAASSRWIPLAGRDSDLIVVSGLTGRVFACEKDWPPLRLLAGSLTEWFEAFAARVVADDYALEEGFGDYYLSLRDREAEQREEKREQARQQAERYRRETPLPVQLREALARKDGDRSREVFEDAASRSPAQLAELTALLFATTRDPSLVATSLQVVLRSVDLTPAQWQLVAQGGRTLGNEAICGFALEKAGGAASAGDSAKKPWWRFW